MQIFIYFFIEITESVDARRHRFYTPAPAKKRVFISATSVKQIEAKSNSEEETITSNTRSKKAAKKIL
jgi:hypothetical protein